MWRAAPLFALLDAFDIALAHSPTRAIYEIEGVPDSFPEFNAGVILYRRSAGVKAAFRDWANQFARFQEQRDRGEICWLQPEGKRIYMHDQGALRAALYRSRLRIATLPPEYNCRFTKPGFVDGPVKIFHGRGLDWRKSPRRSMRAPPGAATRSVRAASRSGAIQRRAATPTVSRTFDPPCADAASAGPPRRPFADCSGRPDGGA